VQTKGHSVIDESGYRPNVGIIIVNKEGQLFWGKRVNQDAWQFPQGGMREHETPQQAVFRELKEEVGLEPSDVRVLGRTQDWLHYDLPRHLIRQHSQPICIGQKQIWFLLGMVADEGSIDVTAHEEPEFEGWEWVDYWVPVQKVVSFKQAVYHQALTELESFLHQFWFKNLSSK
jgi:putative (di)nucleoside polyphosphate hydrolase